VSKPSILLHQAVHNRPEYTELSIASIAQRTHYPNWTWIVTAIACDPPTTQLLNTLKADYGFTLITHRENKGQWPPCDFAFQNARTDLVSHIQNDIIVPHGWLSQLEDCLFACKASVVAACPLAEQHLPPPKCNTANGLGIHITSHIAGTAFLMPETFYLKHRPIYSGHLIFGFTTWIKQRIAQGAVVGYAAPKIPLIHMDADHYAFSLRETKYKAYTDMLYNARHRTDRPKGVWP